MAADISTQIRIATKSLGAIRKWTSKYPMHMALVLSTLGLQYTVSTMIDSEHVKPLLTFVTRYLGAMQPWLWTAYGVLLLIALSLTAYRLRHPILGGARSIEEDEVQERIREASNGATSMRIFAGDASFLDQDHKQLEHILTYRDNAKILLRRPTSERVPAISKLLENGVAAREYAHDDHNQTIRGRLVTLPNTKKTCLFGRRGSVFEYFEIDNLGVGDVFFTHFDRLFDRGRHPLIRAVIFDLAGVAFKGDIRKFYKQVGEIVGTPISLQHQDYLCVDRDLNLGNRDVIGWLTQKSGVTFTPQQASRIVSAWGNTWKKNEEVHALAQKLRQAGYVTAIASNCDKENGDKYRSNQLLVHFDHVFLSYELGLLKPETAFFTAMTKKLGLSPQQCLLIDDHEYNTQAAEAFGMHAILVERHRRDHDTAEAISRRLEKIRVGVQ